MFTQQMIIYKEALQLVCDECGVSPNEIITSRNRKASGARIILIHTISPYIDDEAIAKELCRSRQGICYIRNSRMDSTLTASYKQVASKLNLWLQQQD